MRILQIDIPARALNNGLKGIRMQRLGQVVALFGPNGSGKTRLLWMIDSIIRQDMEWGNNDLIRDIKLGVEVETSNALRDELKKLIAEKDRLGALGDAEFTIKIGRLQENIIERKASIAIQSEKVRMLKTYPERSAQWYSSAPAKDTLIIRLEPDLAALSKVGRISNFDISSAVTNHLSLLDKPDQVSPGVMPFFYSLALAASNENNRQVAGPMQDHRLNLFRLAQELVRKMLRTELGFAYRDYWGDIVPTLAGRGINDAQLSSGEKLLLYYVACLLVKVAI